MTLARLSGTFALVKSLTETPARDGSVNRGMVV